MLNIRKVRNKKMIQLLEILLDIWLMAKYLVSGFIILMLLQLICYQVFKFNIIKTIDKILWEEAKR